MNEELYKKTDYLAALTIDEAAFPIRCRDAELRDLIRLDRATTIDGILGTSQATQGSFQILINEDNLYPPDGPYSMHITAKGPDILLQIKGGDGKEALVAPVPRRLITFASKSSYQAFLEGERGNDITKRDDPFRVRIFERQRASQHASHVDELSNEIQKSRLWGEFFVLKKLFLLLTIIVDRDPAATMGMRAAGGGTFDLAPR